MGLSSDVLRGYIDAIILRRPGEAEGRSCRINREAAAPGGGDFEREEAGLAVFRRLPPMETAGWTQLVLPEAGTPRP